MLVLRRAELQAMPLEYNIIMCNLQQKSYKARRNPSQTHSCQYHKRNAMVSSVHLRITIGRRPVPYISTSLSRPTLPGDRSFYFLVSSVTPLHTSTSTQQSEWRDRTHVKGRPMHDISFHSLVDSFNHPLRDRLEYNSRRYTMAKEFVKFGSDLHHSSWGLFLDN